MPYALFLASCGMGSPMLLLLFLDLAFPSNLDWILYSLPLFLSLPGLLGLCSPSFYLGYSPIELWDSLSGYVHPGIACLAFWASDWLVIHPSMTLVKLIMIGHCCDCLVGGLNCLVSTCWLIVQPRLCSSTLLQWL